ncbi:steroidogenic acute regulatory protein-like [Hyposmocoma kahamanoa]|uniref:steroidogenic acute regulatory protein-like n=1 Tax=Hyposmocoma kahamanoa TaxID=1477025 RepID=UPI000E6D7784|nr:steroidogenic acute regulatory protein-like [Hyposmocoma kahamanoa]
MADRRHIREAAESLLGSVTGPHYCRNLSHSQSINLVSEDLVAGHRPHGKMSTVRRFFCLFVTFDILFSSLMWLICVMMRGETLEQIVEREIIHYNIKTSLFDIVLVAIIRFVVLLLFYGLLYINNWSIIALSTGGTCAFLISKVFFYDWPNASTPVYQVFLILASFTLSWGETWFLDFRVLPQEQQAKYILEAIGGHTSERTPLLNTCNERASPLRPPGVQSTYGESTVNWFSPVETPESSPKRRRPGEQLILTQEQGLVDCPIKFLHDEFKNNIVRIPEWNPTILQSEFIKEIADGIDLTYQVTAGGGRGIISPRDFVNLRRVAPMTKDGRVTDGEPYCYVISAISVKVPDYPPRSDMVRGNNKVSCWVLKPKSVQLPDGRIVQTTVFQWLLCCDLKGKIPQFVLDAAFATVMLDYIVHLRKFAANAKAKGLF